MIRNKSLNIGALLKKKNEKKAEEELAVAENLYCLGDIVHNGRECERLRNMGLITVDHDALRDLVDVKLLLRAHGEPPSTYIQAKSRNIDIIVNIAVCIDK